ncbi:MAG: HEAT repeat domain-containing protein [Planctomycetota bacterium]
MNRADSLIRPILFGMLLAPAALGQAVLETTTVDALSVSADAVVAGEVIFVAIGDQKMTGSLMGEDLIVGDGDALTASFTVSQSPDDGPMASMRCIVFLKRDIDGWRPLGGERGFLEVTDSLQIAAIARRVHLARATSLERERLESWVQDLGSPVTRLRSDAALCLGHLPEIRWADAEHVALIGQALGDAQGTETRSELIRALGRTGRPEAAATLIEYATQLDDLNSLDEVVWALSKLRVDRVAMAFDSVSPESERGRAIRTCLGGRLGVIAADALMPLLGDSDPAIRCAAVCALRSNGDPETIDALDEVLSDASREVRRTALVTLASFRNEDSTRRLEERRMLEQDPELRWLIKELLVSPAIHLAPVTPSR